MTVEGDGHRDPEEANDSGVESSSSDSDSCCQNSFKEEAKPRRKSTRVQPATAKVNVKAKPADFQSPARSGKAGANAAEEAPRKTPPKPKQKAEGTPPPEDAMQTASSLLAVLNSELTIDNMWMAKLRERDVSVRLKRAMSTVDALSLQMNNADGASLTALQKIVTELEAKVEQVNESVNLFTQVRATAGGGDFVIGRACLAALAQACPNTLSAIVTAVMMKTIEATCSWLGSSAFLNWGSW